MGVSSTPHGSRICIFFGITLRRNPTRDPSTREPTVEAAALPASTARSSILNSAVTSSQNCRPGGRYGELRRGLWMGGPGFEGGVRDLFEYPRVVLMVDNALQHSPDPRGQAFSRRLVEAFRLQRACGQRAVTKVATFDSKGLVDSAPEQKHVAPRKIREEFLRRQLLLAEGHEDL